jgi:glycosyltransferase involved in cell wall biosynthesis
MINQSGRTNHRLTDKVLILGEKPPEEIPYYLGAADVLVSQRTLGTNIPLKIYAYLKSGTPVVAANLYTHTQSINQDIAILTDPEPEKFAADILGAASGKGKTISENANAFCQKNYIYERYFELIDQTLKKTQQQ